jgi:hypothetical protein
MYVNIKKIKLYKSEFKVYFLDKHFKYVYLIEKIIILYKNK